MVSVRMQDIMVRTRIAPSPTGEDLHIGNVYTALINYIFTKQQGGKFIVRIEDTDRKRLVAGSEKRILQSLAWLGLVSQESPDVGGPYAPYRQSERKDLYQKHALALIKKGAAYYCFCTPERLSEVRLKQQQGGKPPMYDGFCKAESPGNVRKKLQKGEKYVIRLNVPDSGQTIFDDLVRGKVTFENKLIDDQVLLKSDGYPTYHLAVVVDDYLMKITHVIRAEEWLPSTPKHILLYKAFGWKQPFFAHTPILRNPDKSKLSKRRNPVWVSWYKEQGFLPQALDNYLLTLGWSHPEEKTIFPLTEAIEKFSFDRVVKSGPIFDLTKLTWMNGEYIRMMKNDDLADILYSFLGKKYDRVILMRISPLLKERIKKLSEAEALIDFFFAPPKVDEKLLLVKKRTQNEVKTALENVLKHFQLLSNWNAGTLRDEGNKLLKELNWKPLELFQLIRITISGKIVTPPLFESMEIIGKEEIISRIRKALESFENRKIDYPN